MARNVLLTRQRVDYVSPALVPVSCIYVVIPGIELSLIVSSCSFLNPIFIFLPALNGGGYLSAFHQECTTQYIK